MGVDTEGVLGRNRGWNTVKIHHKHASHSQRINKILDQNKNTLIKDVYTYTHIHWISCNTQNFAQMKPWEKIAQKAADFDKELPAPVSQKGSGL